MNKYFSLVVCSLLLLTACGGSHQPPPPLAITLASLPNGTVQTQYSQSVQASGGVAPYAWTVRAGSLPHNLQLSPSTSNTVTISGTPDTAVQADTFTLQINDSANQSATQAYTVSILGEPDTLTLSPGGLDFNSQLVGTASGAQTVTLTNTGTLPVAINSVGTTGTNATEFGETNTCGSSLAPGANCSISVTFTPNQPGPGTAGVTITDDTVGSPHGFSLNGIGLSSGPNATFSATNLTFPNQNVGTTSASFPVTVTNYGATALDITNITATSNFAGSNSCVGSVAPGASCYIDVAFTPSTTGTLTGSLSVADNAPGTPQMISLSGTGFISHNTLTGYCWGMMQGTNQCALVQDLTNCPAGQIANEPVRVVGCLPPSSQLVDDSRACAAKARTGLMVLGSCTAK